MSSTTSQSQSRMSGQVFTPGKLKEDPKKWKRVDVRRFLESKSEEYDLNQKHITFLYEQEVSGHVFVELNKEDLATFYKLPRGAAAAVEILVNSLRRPRGKSPTTTLQYPVLIYLIVLETPTSPEVDSCPINFSREPQGRSLVTTLQYLVLIYLIVLGTPTSPKVDPCPKSWDKVLGNSVREYRGGNQIVGKYWEEEDEDEDEEDQAYKK